MCISGFSALALCFLFPLGVAGAQTVPETTTLVPQPGVSVPGSGRTAVLWSSGAGATSTPSGTQGTVLAGDGSRDWCMDGGL